MKKPKIFLWILITFICLIATFLIVVLSYHYSYKVTGVSEHIENNTGLVQANGRGLYDENGDEIIFRGVNLGGWFVTEGWLEPYATVDAKVELHEDSGEMRPNYYTTSLATGETLSDKLSQDAMLEAIKANPNLAQGEWIQALNEFYNNWITEEDIINIKNLGFNQVRIPLGWRMFLNDDYTKKSGQELEDSLFYLDRCISWCKKYDIYVVLDLHACPETQNGYEHGGSLVWQESTPGKKYAKLWTNSEAIEATVRIWEMMSDRYNTAEYAKTICMYDLMNEPRNVSGSSDKAVWDVYDKIYDMLRAKGDKHVICMEGMWTYAALPDPATYSWENICYSYHWYNFSPLNKTTKQFELYYAYEDMFNIGRDYNVPVYMGEFSLFEEGGSDATEAFNNTYNRWNSCLSMWEDRHYSWCVWTYKKFVNGWWGDSWGIYNLNACENAFDEYKQKVNVSTANLATLKEAFSFDNIGTSTSCNESIMYKVFEKYLEEKNK